MLHLQPDIILPETLSLLQRLQQDPLLNDYFLVGGTALALQIGHRFSVDLDLFSQSSFDTQQLTQHLENNYYFQLLSVAPNTVMALVENVKVDFITHAYPLVKELLLENGLRFASSLDIAAMKLNAIAHSGQRIKDFYDIYFLLEYFSLKDLLDAYVIKYSKSNPIIALKGLTYFDDIRLEEDKPILRKKRSFATVKRRLEQAAQKTDIIF
jgi:predicted nucleotidyltransferase component of viral defense system